MPELPTSNPTPGGTPAHPAGTRPATSVGPTNVQVTLPVAAWTNYLPVRVWDKRHDRQNDRPAP